MTRTTYIVLYYLRSFLTLDKSRFIDRKKKQKKTKNQQVLHLTIPLLFQQSTKGIQIEIETHPNPLGGGLCFKT